MQTLTNLARYLRSQNTPVISLHETEVYPEAERFYDRVIDSFFAKDKMLIEFSKDTGLFTSDGKMDLIRHILNNCDLQLDTLSEESILIEPNRYSTKNPVDKEKGEANSFNVFLKVNNSRKLVLICSFDEQTNKLLGFSLIGGSGDENK